MNGYAVTHLSAEALDDVMIGLGSQASHAHLAACAGCRAKIEQFQGDVRLFNEASLAWAENRNVNRAAVVRHGGFRIPTPVLSLCAAAMLLVIVGLPTIVRPHHPVVAPVANTGDSTEQIAQDNQLMKDVDAAINPDEASLVDQYQLMGSQPSKLKAYAK